jgi:hypothetical protein
MSVFRRSFAALSGLFLLQLTLLVSGTLCEIHRVARSDGVAHAMHGMNGVATMRRANRASSSVVTSVANVPMSPEGCRDLDGHDGCGLPWAPGQCSTMTTCDVSVAAPASVRTNITTRMVAVALPSPALAESGPTFAPELPPPRA